MSGQIRRTAAYLKALSGDEYKLPSQVTNIVNYLLDGYFAKIEEINRANRRPSVFIPSDPSSHIKEVWLDCDYHKAINLNRSLPSYAKNLNAWAFVCLFEQYGYSIIPFVDQYKFKDMVKNSYGFQIQYEQMATSLNEIQTLPIFGTFFVRSPDNVNLAVTLDLCYNGNGCTVSVMAAPQHQKATEDFIRDLEASSAKNDIYLNKCLSYDQGRLNFMDMLPTTWEDVILKNDVIDNIRNNSISIIHNMEKLASIGMCPNRNTILISPPGMAKTTIFRATSNEVSDCCTRIWCTGKSIEHPDHVTALFEAARNLAPCIIFIEDLDLFGRSRDKLSGSDGQVLNEFLACLDGTSSNSGVVVMASTNDIQSMDEALVNRPGRFDVKIEIPLPDFEDRKSMLHNFLKKLNAVPDTSITQDTLKTVLELCEGLTGAYMKELAKSVVIRAVASGRACGSQVTIVADDLMTAANQVMANYTIGKKAKSRTFEIKS